MRAESEPDFNGMPQETFEAGNRMIDAVRSVPDGQKAVLLAKTSQMLVYETMGDAAARVEDIEEAAGVLAESARQLKNFRQTLERRNNPPEIHDLDY